MNTRKKIVCISPERRRSQHRRRAGLPTASDSHLLYFLLLAEKCLPERGGGPCLPLSTGTHALHDAAFPKVAAPRAQAACRGGASPGSLSSVTTPAPMGAFFRNKEGKDIFLPSKDGERDTGVSLSFYEEVAWGPGWFSPSLRRSLGEKKQGQNSSPAVGAREGGRGGVRGIMGIAMEGME